MVAPALELGSVWLWSPWLAVSYPHMGLRAASWGCRRGTWGGAPSSQWTLSHSVPFRAQPQDRGPRLRREVGQERVSDLPLSLKELRHLDKWREEEGEFSKGQKSLCKVWKQQWSWLLCLTDDSEETCLDQIFIWEGGVQGSLGKEGLGGQSRTFGLSPREWGAVLGFSVREGRPKIVSKGVRLRTPRWRRRRLEAWLGIVSSLGTTVDDGTGDSAHSSRLLSAYCVLDAIARILPVLTCWKIAVDLQGRHYY